ncbi:MAG: YwiC-like family protein [Actinomycetota bacterium]
MSATVATARTSWRQVALPREHGGWGLTLEPIVLGLLVAWSGAGVAIGLAAFMVFLARTPLKVAAVDVRRGNWRARSTLAARIAVAQLAAIVVLAAIAVVAGGSRWLVAVLLAAPLAGVAVWFDIRSRSRRLVPELCGSVAVAAAPAIVLAAGDDWRLAWGVWVVLIARTVASIPFVRAQIRWARSGVADLRSSDLAQLVGVAVALLALGIEPALWLGVAAVVAVTIAQVRWSRRPPPAIKVVGIRQMALGIAVVVAAAIGVSLG